MRTAVSLVVPIARALRWRALAGAGAAGLALVATPAIAGVELAATDLTNLLRIAAVIAAVGVAFIHDDPAIRTTVAVPVPALLTHVVRGLVGLVPVAVWWAVAVLVTTRATKGTAGGDVPVWGLTVEAAATVAVALSLASVRVRSVEDGSAGATVGPAVLLLAAVATGMPDSWRLYAPPSDPAWGDTRHRWAVILIVAAVGWLAVGLSRRPYRPVGPGVGRRAGRQR